jgi:hypothetical protein
MTPKTANVTLIIGVLAFTYGTFTNDWVRQQPTRWVWTIAVCAVLSLCVYYTLWNSSPAPVARPPRGQRPDWLTVEILTLRTPVGLTSTGTFETGIVLTLLVTNSDEKTTALLRLSLANIDRVGLDLSGLHQMRPATEREIIDRQMTVPTGSEDFLYSPLKMEPGKKIGDLWFLTTNRKSVPFGSLMVEDLVSKSLWTVPIAHRRPPQSWFADETMNFLWFDKEKWAKEVPPDRQK